eukprot:gnl/Chilomastix_caulleri/8223.p3 GENE.gnl/Chilomastix_caulleri/8223~~gnl/Chilomastix_caulleri/8223.p3  ORF type:complete len:54 (-),score=1.94 gnl/Chilomastix_caulleri/8223:11-172(-)
MDLSRVSIQEDNLGGETNSFRWGIIGSISNDVSSLDICGANTSDVETNVVSGE